MSEMYQNLSGAPMPTKSCTECGEFLPHWCAPEITVTRDPRTGHRIVQILDRQPDLQEDAAPETTEEPFHTQGAHTLASDTYPLTFPAW